MSFEFKVWFPQVCVDGEDLKERKKKKRKLNEKRTMAVSAYGNEFTNQ